MNLFELNYNPYLMLLICIIIFIGFFILAIYGKRNFKKNAGILSTSIMIVSTIAIFFMGYNYFFNIPIQQEVYNVLPIYYIEWVKISHSLVVNFGFYLDSLSFVMLILIGFISTMVNIYSIKYMKGEERYPHFFSYILLFSFSMIGLVTSSNVIQLFIFWELVGLSSYLLICFYYQKKSAIFAAKKAFIITRIADIFLLIGILIFANYVGSFDISTILNTLSNATSNELIALKKVNSLHISMLDIALVCILLGAFGKSAIFPFHNWLPDAMEGPTPASALIHSATMVVAGVFLIARLYPIFQKDLMVLNLISNIGIFTSIFAALIACVQTDLKKVLAYSTISQIGFMFFALGLMHNQLGFTASLFHLFTHAFFKSTLFLGAGIIIHFVHQNDLKKMGGLYVQMPILHLCMLIACLSISGIPFLSGFFSKELILSISYHTNFNVYIIALFSAGITSFYMFKLYYLVFWNKENTLVNKVQHHSFFYFFPIILLTLITIFIGYIKFGKYVSYNGLSMVNKIDMVETIIPITFSLMGILIAAFFYKKNKEQLVQKINNQLNPIIYIIKNKFFIDSMYNFVYKNVLIAGFSQFCCWIEHIVFENSIKKSNLLLNKMYERAKSFQSGKVQQYQFIYLIGLLFFIGLALWQGFFN